ncbi:MAG: hypothetical protein IT429_03745 [Gemmataceae bacterium]|nr:hypothetical protein [Gemmataceae bacterium]
MAITVPEWLTRRGGGLRQGSDPRVWFAMFQGEPQYRLTPIPVQGKYGCDINQTINGRLIPSTALAASAEEALAAGLEDLRKALGW